MTAEIHYRLGRMAGTMGAVLSCYSVLVGAAAGDTTFPVMPASPRADARRRDQRPVFVCSGSGGGRRTVASIDARWERVTVVDPTVAMTRFGRCVTVQ